MVGGFPGGFHAHPLRSVVPLADLVAEPSGVVVADRQGAVGPEQCLPGGGVVGELVGGVDDVSGPVQQVAVALAAA